MLWAVNIENHTNAEFVCALNDTATFEAGRQQSYVITEESERRARPMIEGIHEPVDLVVLTN